MAQRRLLTTALLACGVLSSLLYLSMNVFIPMQWAAYSSASQTISELSAIGAPTRPLWFALGILYTALVAAFGWGLWAASRENRRLRAAGALLVFSGIFGLFWPPMHLREAPPSLSDTLHIVWSAVTLLIMLFVMGLAAPVFGRRFRQFSLATVAIWLLFGTLTGIEAPRIAENLPTPWIGVWERCNVGAYMLWLVVFAIAMIRRTTTPEPRSRPSTPERKEAPARSA